MRLLLVLFFLLLGSSSNAFLKPPSQRLGPRPTACLVPQRGVPSMRLNAFPTTFPSLTIADVLDADTIGALGDIADADEGLELAVDSSNAAADILTRVVSSPAIIAVPIGAGLLVAFAVGYFIFSYGQGRDD